MLVRRKIANKPDVTFGETVHTHIMHVKRAKPGDVTVGPEVLTDKQLSDLAYRYPREFGEEAKKRGIEPGSKIAIAEDDGPDFLERGDEPPMPETEEDEEPAAERPARTRRPLIPESAAPDASLEEEEDLEELDESEKYFIGLSEGEAVAAITASDDIDQLAKWYDLENERPEKRASVLAAFKEKVGGE